ncbi:hypothetical protein BJ508DRAFT_330879 [Ascobolus immersus RN42]|uniref:Uncharacterized protein n=1 Tax=Ascobolus immersus RN42 TaxID=1160509 RepID=A0A3N4HXX8_ASCIM|nr:hypothetical protein BJ508DRAFT_330879 [Ascobolus immersus RN42]
MSRQYHDPQWEENLRRREEEIKRRFRPARSAQLNETQDETVEAPRHDREQQRQRDQQVREQRELRIIEDYAYQQRMQEMQERRRQQEQQTYHNVGYDPQHGEHWMYSRPQEFRSEQEREEHVRRGEEEIRRRFKQERR